MSSIDSSLKTTLTSQQLVVLTGGPGAGKTAVLELAKSLFGSKVHILPEAASLIFKGGFPRESQLESAKAAQRTIFFVQRQLEILTLAKKDSHLILCDRGTLDGLAYWPEESASFWSENNSQPYTEKARYAAVIHLRTPHENQGYNHQNPFRTEDPIAAQVIDHKIELAWNGHPKRYFVESHDEFLIKASEAMTIISNLIREQSDI